MKYKKIIIGALCALSVGCGSASKDTSIPEPIGPDGGKTVFKSLSYYDSCDALESDMRENLKAQVNAMMDSYLVTTNDRYCYGDILYSPMAEADSSGASFTETNLQETGVDEADIIKTDGQYLYLASKKGVQIFKVWPKEDYAQVANYQIKEATQTKIYLAGSKLIVLYQTGNSTKTHIDILDVSHPEQPVALSQKELSGKLVQSRRVNGILHVVFNSMKTLSNFGIQVPQVSYEDSQKICSGNQSVINAVNSEVESLRAENLKLINDLPINDYMPTYGDSGDAKSLNCTSVAYEVSDDSADADNQSLVKKSSVYMPSYRSSSIQMTGVISLSINDPESIQATLLGGGKNSTWGSYLVYASSDALYLSKSVNYTHTLLHRFQLTEVGRSYHRYTASGSVQGQLLNQFSLSERDSVLRVASEANLETFVTTLDATSPTLEQLGVVGGIGKGEYLRGVRFVGDRGYVVTFKKTDPFFVVNLADPTNPTVEGELKMPGYSSYLHLLDEDHVIGLGKDADDQGSFAWFQGLKLALFDVANPEKPSLVDESILGSRGTTSFALEDHHAFTYDPVSHLLALPLELYEGVKGGSQVGNFKYSGVHLFRLDPENGIQDKGIIQLPDDQTGGSGWENAGPRRVIMLGESDTNKNLIYILGNDSLFQVDQSDANQNLKSLPSDNILESFTYEFL